MTSALRVDRLVKRFPGADRAAVDGLSIDVAEGEFYALLGPNGAGKTTTLRMIAGLLAVDSGSIHVAGVDLAAAPRDAKRVIAYVPDEPMLYDKLTPIEYLELVAALWDVAPMRARDEAERLLDVLGLVPHATQRCETFSRGMRQKLVLAGALIRAPRLLILDEPLTGLDAEAARLAKNLLNDHVHAGGTVILTTHILDVAERMAERIGVIRAGRLVAEGTLAQLREQAKSGSAATLEGRVPRTGRTARDGCGVSATSHALDAPAAPLLSLDRPPLVRLLLRHEWRLTMRDFTSRSAGRGPSAKPKKARAPKRVLIGLAIALVVMHLVGAFAIFAPRHWQDTTPMRLFVLGAIALLFTMMLSATMSRVVAAFHERRDLDLLLAAPIPPLVILYVRATTVVVAVTALFAFFLFPVANMGVISGHWWLARIYLLVPVTAIASTGIALFATGAIVRAIGIRRARIGLQVLSALIGASIYLVSQGQRLLPDTWRHESMAWLVRVSGPDGFTVADRLRAATRERRLAGVGGVHRCERAAVRIRAAIRESPLLRRGPGARERCAFGARRATRGRSPHRARLRAAVVHDAAVQGVEADPSVAAADLPDSAADPVPDAARVPLVRSRVAVGWRRTFMG